MYGTTYGFSLTRRGKEPPSGGGGTGEQLRFQRDLLTQTAAFAADTLAIVLTRTPADTNGLQVWSQGLILHPDDYLILGSPLRVVFRFSADPATDTDTGEWKFVVTYPYVVV
jgi:hypothetical protein